MPATQYFPVRFRPQVPDSPITQAVALPLAGTSRYILRRAAGCIRLVSSSQTREGFVSLTVAADSPLDWPQYFGVMANQNAADHYAV